MSTASQEQPAPATGPRAMAEQSILKIIWPPDGRPAWEDRHKIPRIEQALGQLLDIVESDDVKLTVIKARESQKLTAQVLELRRQGLTMAQIAEVTGLTEYAVIHRISNSKKAQTANAPGAPVGQEGPSSPGTAQQNAKNWVVTPEDIKALQGEPIQPPGITATDLPAALRSAADHIVEANDMVAQAQPKVEQVPGQASLQDASLTQSEKPQDLEHKQSSKSEKVPLTDEQKVQIMDLHGKGCDIPEIKSLLGISDGRLIQGTIMGVKRRKTAENVHAVQSSDTSSQPPKDVMLPQQPANVADTLAAPKSVEEKPAPKAIGRAELDTKIWELHKAGKTPEEISDALYAEGLYYSEKSVIIRLRSQGADI